MKIQTGKSTTIALITLIGIYSISALTSLPGLAVTPILGDLNKVFPEASDLEIQMLSSLPSLLIIPFILLAGKLSEKLDMLHILRLGLIIFALSGFLYLISDKMWQLILVSALLGIGAGIIVPLSTGLISKFFAGKYRTVQFGYSSAITNLTLVLATVLTGYLAESNWRLPFVVYLFPIVSILLSGYLKKDLKIVSEEDDKPQSTVVKPIKDSIDKKRLTKYMIYYGMATFLNICISLNLPFLMEQYKYSSGTAGDLISLFFLSIMVPGFMLKPILSFLKNSAYSICFLIISVGLACFVLSDSIIVIAIGCIIVGLGYGVVQPMIYDKTSAIASSRKVTLALAFVMVMNYLAIVAYPFVVNVANDIFKVKSQLFAFWFSLIVSLISWFVIVIYTKMRKSYE